MQHRGVALTKGFIQELDGLRGIAILMVMVHRFWPRTGVGLGADMAGAGWIGVDLFFVISGFLITGILLETKADAGYFRNFYARRALRIFPLFYVFVMGVFVAFSHNPEFRERAGSPLWYLFHLGNVPEGLLGNNVPYWIAPAWSLAIEEQFYLTFPLLVYLLDRRRLTYVLIGMIGVAPVIRLGTMLAMPDQERVQYLFTLCRIDTIAIGCLLAVAIRSVDLDVWRERARITAFIALPSVVVLAIASHLDRKSAFDRVFGYSIVAVGCASVVGLVILSRGSRSTALLRARPLTYLGKLCFGLYLLHRPADTIVSAVAARLGIDRDLWMLMPKIGVALALAALSWRFFERPFLALKDRFATVRHPGPKLTAAAITIVLAACGQRSFLGGDDADAPSAVPDGGSVIDGRGRDGGSNVDPIPDAMVDAATTGSSAPVLYAEGNRHSPITAAVVARLKDIASASTDPRVFAKVGDSITVAPSFFSCFDGGAVDLAGRSDLSATRSYFMAGDAAGTTPFARVSLAAKGGTTALDALTGNPSPLVQELTATEPKIEVVMFGSNEARYDWTADEFGTYLWTLIDATIARGTVPVMSTIPANTGYPAADARIPTYNRVIRAIAQGRGVPLVDLHLELEPLPDRGISSDGIHPSVAPEGGCVLTSAGLQYGYNVRNLLELEALGRTRAALAGTAANTTAPTRGGHGSEADPFTGLFPLVDLGDTRLGFTHVPHGCGASSGRQVSYRLVIPRSMTIDAMVVDRPGTDVELRILVGGVCLATGSVTASATVPAGAVDVIVDARTPQDEGEFLVVIEPRP